MTNALGSKQPQFFSKFTLLISQTCSIENRMSKDESVRWDTAVSRTGATFCLPKDKTMVLKRPMRYGHEAPWKMLVVELSNKPFLFKDLLFEYIATRIQSRVNSHE